MINAGFLTFLIGLSSVGALMRRRLTIRTTYSPTRSSCEHLAFAYEVLVSSKQREREREEVARGSDIDERTVMRMNRTAR